MKRILCVMLAVICAVFLLAGCGEEVVLKEPPKIGFVVATQFSEYRLGVIDGTIDKKDINELIDNPELVDFKSVDKGVSALKNNKLHGLIVPASYVDGILADNENMSKLYLTFIENEPCAIMRSSFDLRLSMNAACTDITRKGIADNIAIYHISGGKDAKYTRPEGFETFEDRNIRAGISTAEKSPLVYKDKDGNLCGINVDTAYEMAKFVGGNLEIIEFKNDDELFDALDNDEIDIAFANFMPSEEKPISTRYAYTHPYTNLSTEIIINGETPDIVNGI